MFCRIVTLGAFCATLAWAQSGPPPMPVDFTRTTNYRWLNKPVLESRVLDDMETLETWSLENRGEGQGEMGLTTDRRRDGRHSLRLRANTMGVKPGRTMGRPPGSASVIRRVGGENWQPFNRLSFWVYPDLPGFNVVSLLIVFHNDGEQKIPNLWKDGFDFVLVRNHQWNRVTSEIAHLARDKVTGVEIQYRLQGNEPGATATVSFDFDHLELQRVEPDYFEGWNVAPGRISFSHTGYQPGSAKTAIASGLPASEFRLIRQETGETVLRKPLRPVKNRLGEFQVMDFSEVREPGTYLLRAGDAATQPFRIDGNVWRETILKAINFFYAERCGFAIPGVHDVCHRDWMGVHGDRRMVVNGGWHDAGDLSQGLVNTSEAVYAMFDLADRLRSRHEDPELVRRLVDEAKWGLDWVLKTSFHDGYRVTWGTMDFWTDGILGNADDAVADARNLPYENFLASTSEAIAARVLARAEPALAARALASAAEDWTFAVQGMEGGTRRAGNPVELASAGILASLELYRATGDRRFADTALAMTPQILDSQQRSFMPGWKYPITGFFYTSPARDRILHYFHRGHEQGPIVAMARLCEAFPDHPDWMKWYSTVALYSEFFLKEMARFTEPYGMLPASIYADEEYLQAAENRRDFFRVQVQQGIPVGEHHFLRLFPVWFDFRGNLGTMLSATKALSTAAALRGDPATAGLVERQLEWTVGRNPFVQSLIYGEGYDYAPQYTAMSGDIVGSFPVGVQTWGERDVPYWASTNCHNWKEVWVHPASRWIWIMRDLAPPAPKPDFTLSSTAAEDGTVTIEVTANGTGRHRFALRTMNLTGDLREQEGGIRVTWKARAAAANAPWIAVVIPDGDLGRRQETLGK